ncbi:MAG TPA: TMEM175 family protein [Ktedonobacterales bacterium]|nr:TMEM175 family protein [Ktedonobacterales bacterium]
MAEEDEEAQQPQQTQQQKQTGQLPSTFSPARMEAFSDGVMAVIITIMVLELRPPDGAGLDDLLSVHAKFLVYVLSFVYIGIYWNNHHHLLRATPHINGAVMWANLHLLFWLSLVPASTAWAGENLTALGPAVIYGGVAFMAGVAYYILVRFIIRANHGADIEKAIGGDFKGIISLVIYALGMLVALIFPPVLAYFIYAIVSVIWFIPDRRLTRR